VINYTTFQDVIDHGFDYLGGTPSEQVKRDCVRAALEAYRDLANAFNWSYLYTHSRVYTSGSFDGSQTGCTIQYQGTGGAYDRMVTISGGTWPDWVAEGTYIRLASLDDYVGGATVGYVNYRVAERKSATVITLTETLCPDADIPAGATFILYRDTYILPDDYISQDQALFERNFGGMSDSHPREWLYENRYVFAQGLPRMDTITGDRHQPGRLVARIRHPAP
jgi:hypothetical protein